MPRPARLNLPDILQHITQRGNNRLVCFHVDNDYRLYLELLHDACRAHDCSLHAYVLMTNHAHLLMTPATPEGVSKVMRDLGRDYVRAINRTYHRTGPPTGNDRFRRQIEQALSIKLGHGKRGRPEKSPRLKNVSGPFIPRLLCVLWLLVEYTI
jgi:putative transposase